MGGKERWIPDQVWNGIVGCASHANLYFHPSWRWLQARMEDYLENEIPLRRRMLRPDGAKGESELQVDNSFSYFVGGAAHHDKLLWFIGRFGADCL
jgi:hypothetical protein